MLSESVRKKIGQTLCFGFEGPEYTDDLDRFLQKTYCANIILFSRNYQDPVQLKRLTAALHRRIREITGTTALITVDQEGGCVTRLMTGVTFPAGAATCGNTAYPDAAHVTGQHIGEDMIRLGLNVNLAPVLDIDPRDDLRFTEIRHYSSDPERVAALGGDFIRGLSGFGVLGCAKHFPGSGDGKTDTHYDMCRIEKGVEELLSHDLLPFLRNNTVPCMMTTHTIFSKVDSLPSTLSRNVITGILRERMGYDGIVITDDLEMEAIKKYFGAADAALRSLRAGADVVLCCHTRSTQEAIFEALCGAYEAGELTDAMLDEKTARLGRFRAFSQSYLDRFFDPAAPYVCSEEHNRIQQEIVDRSIQTVCGTLPEITEHTLFVAPEAFSVNAAEGTFSERSLPALLRRDFPACDTVTLNDTPECRAAIFDRLDKYDKVVYFTYNVNYRPYQARYANEIAGRKPLYLFSMKGKADLPLYDNPQNYAVAWEYTPNSIRAVGKLMKKGKT